MASPQIKIFTSLAAVAIIYAFLCNIRISRKARELANRLQKERPELWSSLNPFTRNYNGGHPGLKLLYRQKVVDLPGFDEAYEKLHAIERKLLWGIAIGAACIGAVIIGTRYWGWHW